MTVMIICNDRTNAWYMNMQDKGHFVHVYLCVLLRADYEAAPFIAIWIREQDTSYLV